MVNKNSFKFSLEIKANTPSVSTYSYKHYRYLQNIPHWQLQIINTCFRIHI